VRQRRGKILAWGLALAWLTWSTALSGWLGGGGLFAGWAPDLAVALLASLAGFLAARDVPRLVLLAALARASLSMDAPLPLLTGFLAIGALTNLVRHFVDLRGPFARAGLAAVGAPALAAWLALVHAARTGEPLLMDLGDLARLGFSSGLLALVAGDLLARLPGLSPLRRRSW
jgi:hypothetical protein